MFTNNTQGMGTAEISNQAPSDTASRYAAKSRRTNKTLVELSIGVIGLIGIMLAQLANNHQVSKLAQSSSGQYQVMSDISEEISAKVERLSKASPVVSQINLTNIIF